MHLTRSSILLTAFTASWAAFTPAAASPPSYRKTCTVPSLFTSSNGTANDSPAINHAFANCSYGGIVRFLEGVDYNVFTPIAAKNLTNVEIQMYGNLHLPQNITYMQRIFNETVGASGTNLYWFEFSGPGISYTSTSNVTTGWIKSYGQAWWDANPVNGTGLDGRPHLTLFNTTNGRIKYLKSLQPIAWNHRLVGKNISVSHSIIEAFSTGGFPFNTDGFQVAGTDITIEDSVIYNGDDAFAIQSGAHNALVRSATVGYASHGLSIGSLGQNQGLFANVSNIFFDDITMIDTVYGARFKSWIGGQGSAKNVTWNNIRVYNVSFPIFVTQTYVNQGSAQTQIENGTATYTRPNNSTVEMQDFTWSNWVGSINTYQPGDGSCVTDPCWYDIGLPDLKHTEAIIVECNTNTSCKNFQMQNIQISPQSMQAPTTVCFNATSELNPGLGFECGNGTFVPTL